MEYKMDDLDQGGNILNEEMGVFVREKEKSESYAKTYVGGKPN